MQELAHFSPAALPTAHAKILASTQTGTQDVLGASQQLPRAASSLSDWDSLGVSRKMGTQGVLSAHNPIIDVRPRSMTPTPVGGRANMHRNPWAKHSQYKPYPANNLSQSSLSSAEYRADRSWSLDPIALPSYLSSYSNSSTSDKTIPQEITDCNTLNHAVSNSNKLNKPSDYISSANEVPNPSGMRNGPGVLKNLKPLIAEDDNSRQNVSGPSQM